MQATLWYTGSGVAGIADTIRQRDAHVRIALAVGSSGVQYMVNLFLTRGEFEFRTSGLDDLAFLSHWGRYLAALRAYRADRSLATDEREVEENHRDEEAVDAYVAHQRPLGEGEGSGIEAEVEVISADLGKTVLHWLELSQTGRVDARTAFLDRHWVDVEIAQLVGHLDPVLFRGPVGGRSRGEAVKTVQLALRHLGFEPGPADGLFGPKTRSAIKAFQRARRLDTVGHIGPQTWLALGESLRKRGSV